MTRKVKVLVFHAKSYIGNKANGSEVVKEIENSASAFAAEIGCLYIDVVKRTIGGKRYNIICDDDALGDENATIALLDRQNQNNNIFGTIIIAGEEDRYGELTDLSDDDIGNIVSRIGYVAGQIQEKETVCQVIVIS